MAGKRVPKGQVQAGTGPDQADVTGENIVTRQAAASAATCQGISTRAAPNECACKIIGLRLRGSRDSEERQLGGWVPPDPTDRGSELNLLAHARARTLTHTYVVGARENERANGRAARAPQLPPVKSPPTGV